MNKHIIALLIVFTVFNLHLSAQAVLLEQDVSKDTIVRKVGPNLRHFHQAYLSMGFPVYENNKGAEIAYGSSSYFDFGYRYKLKVCNFYALGTDLWMGFANNKLKQNANKVLPDTILNDKENLNFSNISAGIYNRINIGKRGNHLGNYIDFGAYGQATYYLVHYTRNKMPNGNLVETYTKRLKYHNPYNWGIMARIGFNRFVITAQYLMSDVFKSSYNYPELPRLNVGLQLGIF